MNTKDSTSNDELKELFNLIDTSGKGYLNTLDIQRMLGIIESDPNWSFAAQVLSEVDHNNDGKVRFKELKEGFDKLDTVTAA